MPPEFVSGSPVTRALAALFAGSLLEAGAVLCHPRAGEAQLRRPRRPPGAAGVLFAKGVPHDPQRAGSPSAAPTHEPRENESEGAHHGTGAHKRGSMLLGALRGVGALGVFRPVWNVGQMFRT